MITPSAPGLAVPRGAFHESYCLGMQYKMGGKSLLRLNTDERPIANKYREGKMKRTLKRELTVLEIVEREAFERCSCAQAYAFLTSRCMY